MVNPYEPPKDNSRFLSFGQRFQRALKRALREYRDGLVREKITTLEHLRLWFSLVLVGLFFVVPFLIWATMYLMKFLDVVLPNS